MIQLNTPKLTIFESELYRTTSTLIIGKEYVLLIDPNWLKGEIEFIHQYLSDRKGKRKTYILFTHSDFDHIIGYGKFKTFNSIASKRFVENDKKVEKIEKNQFI